MGIVRIKKYYARKKIDRSGIDAARTVLNKLFTNSDGRIYRFVYPTHDVSVQDFDHATAILGKYGPTDFFSISASSAAGRYAHLDFTNRDYVALEFHSAKVDPDQPIDEIADKLSLRTVKQLVNSAFIAHGFNHAGKAYALEISMFLGLLGIDVVTGGYYEPRSVSEKVRDRIAECDIFIAVVTPQDDHTWVIQETTLADTLGKQPMVLIEETVQHKRGLRGDHEDISFQEGQIAATFNKILQGINTIRIST